LIGWNVHAGDSYYGKNVNDCAMDLRTNELYHLMIQAKDSNGMTMRVCDIIPGFLVFSEVFQLVKNSCVFYDLFKKLGVHENGFIYSIKFLPVTEVI
jgi:hypothetical protein